jgi:anthranilate synthase/indole-3-glycerol phosphate synthase/phosphoribosylanthranilate isomerase
LIDEYQVYEARAYGADSVLLIVASLKQQEVESGLLTRLLKLARELGMEPLVEVNSDDEMHIALQIGAKVIGINNRNLHNFHVDMDTTKRLLNGKGTTIPEDVIVAALSGIVTRDDVKHFEAAGAKAILVGETLMRSSDPARKILELQGFVPPIVKICGVKTVEMAIATAEAGADMIGLVFAQGSKRLVSVQLAKEIADAIRQWRRQQHSHNQQPPTATTTTTTSSNTANTEYVDSSRRMHEAVQHAKPLLVGVFANNSLDEVNQIAAEVGLDYVQLSGHEGFEAARQTKQPCIRALHVGNGTITELLTKIEPGAAALLLDTMDPTALGGTGRAFNWDIAVQLSATTPFFLAGGLTPDNVGGAVRKVRPFGIDVSSGVETDGQKDITKIKDFVKRAKLVEL